MKLLPAALLLTILPLLYCSNISDINRPQTPAGKWNYYLQQQKTCIAIAQDGACVCSLFSCSTFADTLVLDENGRFKWYTLMSPNTSRACNIDGCDYDSLHWARQWVIQQEASATGLWSFSDSTLMLMTDSLGGMNLHDTLKYSAIISSDGRNLDLIGDNICNLLSSLRGDTSSLFGYGVKKTFVR